MQGSVSSLIANQLTYEKASHSKCWKDKNPFTPETNAHNILKYSPYLAENILYLHHEHSWINAVKETLFI